MKALRALLLVTGVALAPATHADHVDPYETIDRAFTAFDGGKGYDAARGVLSAALREAPHGGRLDPSFALVFAVYSDLVRNQDHPSFALQLAEQGLALALDAGEPDEEVKNALLVSRAYALADLGRYREAIETATIAALWLGERFGRAEREALEAEAREWARQEGLGPDSELPSALQTALELLRRSQDALVAFDTATAIMLASRAILPEEAELEGAERIVNAWSRMITGTAYIAENRDREAVAVLRAAVDLLVEEPWDGRSRPRLREALAGESARYIVWNVFIRLAQSALDIGDSELGAASLDIAQEYVGTPEDRYSLLVQRAALSMHGGSLDEVEKAFMASEAEARAAGDEENAALARFYASVIRLRVTSAAGAVEGEGEAMLERAREAATAAQDNPRQVEYIMTSAVWQAVINAVPHQAVLPVAREAFDAFRAGQRAMIGYDSGQEAARRERRRFLESYLDALYDSTEEQRP